MIEELRVGVVGAEIVRLLIVILLAGVAEVRKTVLLGEALVMKMKIFKGTDLQSLESKINEWLEAKGINLVHHITHANNLGTTIITVWWGE